MDDECDVGDSGGVAGDDSGGTNAGGGKAGVTGETTDAENTGGGSELRRMGIFVSCDLEGMTVGGGDFGNGGKYVLGGAAAVDAEADLVTEYLSLSR